MTFWDQIDYAYPEIFLALAAMGLLILGVFIGDKGSREIGFGAVGILIIATFLTGFNGSADRVSIFDGAFAIDSYAVFAKCALYLGAIFAILLSDRFLVREKLQRFEYSILILLAVLGMSIMVSATDLIAMYLGIELQSLALYIMAAFNRDSRRSTEAGMKYFVLGALSSGLLLYGASLVYGFSGATNFAAIAEGAAAGGNNIGLIFGLVFMVSALAFKVSAAPFHMWTPDVYEGAPTPVTTFFASVPKVAGMVLFARFLVEAFPSILDQWQGVIALMAAASMAVGAYSAMQQTNIKRLMAYSSIGHMGFVLMAVAAGNNEGVSAMLIYMTIYLVMTLGTFALILSMRRPEGMSEKIEDLSGLSKSDPARAFMFTVLFFSLAGIPPLAGFFAKFFVFLAAVNAGLLWLAIFGVLMSAVSAYYYLRVIYFIWFKEPVASFEKQTGAAISVTAWSSTLFMVLGLITLIGPLRLLAEKAASVLF